MHLTIDDYLNIYGRAFQANSKQADNVMDDWVLGWIEAEYTYCAWALVVVGGEPYWG